MFVLRSTVRAMGSWVRCLVGMDIWRRLYMSSYVGAGVFKICRLREKFGVLTEIQMWCHVHCTLPAIHLCSDFRTVSISIALVAWPTFWTSGIKFHDTALFSQPHDAICHTTLNSSRMVLYIFMHLCIYLWFVQWHWLVTDWYESGTKPSWSELKYYLGICLEWLGNQRNAFQDSRSNQKSLIWSSSAHQLTAFATGRSLVSSSY